MSSGQTKQDLQLNISSRTVRRVLSSSPSVVYKKYQSKPPLTQSHKDSRFEFAQRSIRDRTDWSKIVWSDEKKFNLDGSDGIRYIDMI